MQVFVQAHCVVRFTLAKQGVNFICVLTSTELEANQNPVHLLSTSLQVMIVSLIRNYLIYLMAKNLGKDKLVLKKGRKN